MAQRIRLRREGEAQVVDIPRSLELPGEEVEIERSPSGLTLRPMVSNVGWSTGAGLAAILATMEPLPEEDWLPDIDDPPPEPFDL